MRVGKSPLKPDPEYRDPHVVINPNLYHFESYHSDMS